MATSGWNSSLCWDAPSILTGPLVIITRAWKDCVRPTLTIDRLFVAIFADKIAKKSLAGRSVNTSKYK